ncbi:MAG: dehydrogenase [Bifidobacterium scardovii]|uniref:dehydrogenase n=1 Tax=Bifidobacterium scardovii TaxID=158787 RepID=UPI0028FDE11A|nr:dehydrogenase [Bifidobacterium scardovii]MDU2421831.1 dehydrogenase [Bifidobacterium scardovii]
MTDHLATGMKRMIRTVARSASLSDRLGEQSRVLRLTGNRSTLDFRPSAHGESSWDFEMSITPAEPYGNTETRGPVWHETVDSATYGESRARVANAVETFKRYDNTGFLPENQ